MLCINRKFDVIKLAEPWPAPSPCYTNTWRRQNTHVSAVFSLFTGCFCLPLAKGKHSGLTEPEPNVQLNPKHRRLLCCTTPRLNQPHFHHYSVSVSQRLGYLWMVLSLVFRLITFRREHDVVITAGCFLVLRSLSNCCVVYCTHSVSPLVGTPVK